MSALCSPLNGVGVLVAAHPAFVASLALLNHSPRWRASRWLENYVAPFRITKGEGFRLKDFDPSDTCGLSLEKGEAAELLQRGTAWLAEEQEMLYAEGRRSLLMVLQAMDAAGKDGTIKHVMSGVKANQPHCPTFLTFRPNNLDYYEALFLLLVRQVQEEFESREILNSRRPQERINHG